MKKIIRRSLLAAALVSAGSAQALDFQTLAGASFTEYFNLTPATSNRLVFSVGGIAAQFSSLSFEVLGGGPSANATVNAGNLIASFSDPRNNAFLLTGGTPYLLKVSGVTNAAPPGTFGLVSINVLNGTVSPVPEADSLAMLLAGLGVMGAVARRRKTKGC